MKKKLFNLFDQDGIRVRIGVPILVLWTAVIVTTIIIQAKFPLIHNEYNLILGILCVFLTICLNVILITGVWTLDVDVRKLGRIIGEKPKEDVKLIDASTLDEHFYMPAHPTHTLKKLKESGIMSYVDCVVSSPFMSFRNGTYHIPAYQYNDTVLELIKTSDRCFLLWNADNIPFVDNKIRVLILKNVNGKWEAHDVLC